MRSNTVFGTTKVTLADSFIENMPESLNKVEYFKQLFKDIKYSMTHDKEYSSCLLEGSWEAVVQMEYLLRSSLNEWISSEEKDSVSSDMCHQSSDGLKIPTTLQDENKIQIFEIDQANLLLSQSPESNDFGNCLFDKCSKSSSEHAGRRGTLSSDNQQKNEPFACRGKQAGPSQETDDPHLDRAPSAENEVYMDIQLEHNYNHLKSDKNTDLMTDEPIVENEIYMDIKLSKTNNESFTNPDLPVMLVVGKEDEPGIEVLKLNVNKANGERLGEGSVAIKQSEDLKLRRKTYEEKAPFKYFCNQCSFKTKRNSHMRNHSRFHERICTIYSCDQCDFSTIRASHLQRHVGTHKPEVFACFECSYNTHSDRLFKRHQRCKHSAVKSQRGAPKTGDTYQCLQCDYMTTSEKIFQRHLAVHSKKKGNLKQPCFKCKQCSYQTPSRSNFYRHLGGVHGDERPYLCKTCGLRFKRSDTLAQHQTTHVGSEDMGKNAFQCSQCEKYYRSANALEEHKLTHEEERRYLCEICGSSFKTRAVQRKHFNETHVHTKVNPCPTCSKTFTTKYLLKRHMKVHLQDKGSSVPANSSTKEVVSSTISSMDWCASRPTQQSPSDIQVFVVQEPSQQQLQGGQLLEVSPSLVGSQTVSVLPVEYVISAGDLEDEKLDEAATVNVTSAQAHIQPCDGDIITLAFVQ